MSALEPNSERAEIRAAIRDLVGGTARARSAIDAADGPAGVDESLANAVATEFGVGGLVVPESLGGSGGDFADLSVVVEELGAALAPVALFSTVAQAVPLLLDLPGGAGDDLLRGIADGRTRAVVLRVADAVSGTSGEAETVTVSGDAWPVVDGDRADLLLVVAGVGDDAVLLAVDAEAPGVTSTPLRSIDVTRTFARIVVDGAPGRVVAAHGVERAHSVAQQAAIVLLAAEQVGGAQHVLDEAVEYAKVREQFGQRIGGFQAIQHTLVDLLLEVESARAAQLAAVDALDAYFGAPGPETLAALGLAASIAGAAASHAYRIVSDEGLHVHGGIGFTWEHDAHLYFRRALADDVLFGTTEAALDRVAEAAGL